MTYDGGAGKFFSPKEPGFYYERDNDHGDYPRGVGERESEGREIRPGQSQHLYILKSVAADVAAFTSCPRPDYCHGGGRNEQRRAGVDWRWRIHLVH